MTSAVDERDASDELATRYGRSRAGRRGARARGPHGDGTGDSESAGRDRRPWSRVGVIVTAVLTVATIAFWGLTQWQQGASATVSTSVVNFRIPDDGTIEADVRYTVYPGTAMSCALEATNDMHLVVGWTVVDLPPSDTSTRIVTSEVRTTQRAATIVVKSCWVA